MDLFEAFVLVVCGMGIGASAAFFMTLRRDLSQSMPRRLQPPSWSDRRAAFRRLEDRYPDRFRRPAEPVSPKDAA